MSWKKLLESVSEPLNDHLQLRNDYLIAENRILRHQIDGRVQLTDSERKELAEMGAKLGKKALAEIAAIATPDTILPWNWCGHGLDWRRALPCPLCSASVVYVEAGLPQTQVFFVPHHRGM